MPPYANPAPPNPGYATGGTGMKKVVFVVCLNRACGNLYCRISHFICRFIEYIVLKFCCCLLLLVISF